MIGQETWNMSEKYLEEYQGKEGEIKNTQLAEEFLPMQEVPCKSGSLEGSFSFLRASSGPN